MGVFFSVWTSGRWESRILPLESLQLSGLGEGGGGALVAAVMCGFLFSFWLAVELWLEEEYDLCTYYPRGYISWVLGVVRVFHSPGGSGWRALLPCGHEDWASLILGFGVVLGWWGSGAWSRRGGDLGVC